MRHRTELPQVINVDVTTHDEPAGAADYVRSKIDYHSDASRQ
jgi:hypothetical protein